MKKLVSVLAVLTCVFGLTACGGTEVNTVDGAAISDVSTESYVISYGESLVTTIDTIVRAGESAYYADDDVLSDAMDSYESSMDDIGEITGFDNEQAVIDDDGNYVVNIGIVGTDHSADVVITIDMTEGMLSSMTTDVRYSFGELIGQAGLNTLLGMGTTFVVLILLMVVIYCFKFIGVFQAKKSQKAAMKKEAEAPAPAPAASGTDTQQTAAAAAPEEEVDDEELIAVIAAAVAAYEEEAGTEGTDGFVVRSIRKSRRKA